LAAICGGKTIRTVSFLGSFGSAITQNRSTENSLKTTRLSLPNFVSRQISPQGISGQKIVSTASGDSAPNEFAHWRRPG
jgi:hypothetical protein